MMSLLPGEDIGTEVYEDEKLKLYTIYSPPEHPDKTIHKTKEEAAIESRSLK